MSKTPIVTALLVCLLQAAPVNPFLLKAAMAAGIDDYANPFNNFTRQPPAQPKSVELPQQRTLDDMIVRSPMVVQGMNPIWLKGLRISGLQPKSVETLGNTYFVVVDNTKYLRMSEIYKQNKLNGKSTYVTADSIIHPYFAFCNRILAEVIVHDITPDLRLLLKAMQTVATEDYKSAEDIDVRRDIARNLAYIATALRLIDPHYEAPNVSSVPEMVDQEVHNIVTGVNAESPVFDGVQDYSLFTPIGWYNSSSELKNFYRCREWLSLVPFAITDTSEGRANNTFRRSVLLFRSLYQANIIGRPAMETWARIVKYDKLLGCQIDSYHQRTLYPDDYDMVLQQKASNLSVTLQSLAEPFFRTKLMLAVRNSKNNVLEAESVLQMSDEDSSSTAGVFRLFPMIGQPEMPWLRGISQFYPQDRNLSPSWPVSLLDMYSWGSGQAGNVLCDNMPALDQRLAFVLPGLGHCIMRRNPVGQLKPVENRTWSVLSPLFKPSEQNAPAVLRTDSLYTQRLISASAGFVDSLCAIAPPIAPPAPAAAKPATSAQTAARPAGTASATQTVAAVPGAPPPAASAQAPAAPCEEGNTSENFGRVTPDQADEAPRRVHHVLPYHYLEPNVELFKHLQADAIKLKASLTAANCFPEQYAGELGDFIRLFARLEKIAETEVTGEKISVVDRRLLANIGDILDKVDVPLPAVLAVNAGDNVPGKSFAAGFNMAIGRPGMLYIIYQNPHTMEWTLGRGAVYTYYEMPAPLLTDAMWEHKLEGGFATPPAWSKKFELVQPDVVAPHTTALSR